jgi:redox-regulated HSP33 family molecular chaperone
MLIEKSECYVFPSLTLIACLLMNGSCQQNQTCLLTLQSDGDIRGVVVYWNNSDGMIGPVPISADTEKIRVTTLGY